MIPYLIKSTICLLLFIAFYKLFLERENMHKIKRVYLIGSLIFSGIIPIITFTYTKTIIADSIEQERVITPTVIAAEKAIENVPQFNYWELILWSIYAIGVVLFLFRFIRNLKGIRTKIKIHEKEKTPSYTNVLLDKKTVPHTFLDYIFVTKKEYKEQHIPSEVLLHEQAHVAQKHTFDILFIEVLQIIFWFNPLWIVVKRAVKLNHEFLADQQVIQQQNSVVSYQKLLIEYPQHFNQNALSSAVNYSLTKKRLQMMTTRFSKKRTAVKLLMLLPILGFSAFAFNHKIETTYEMVTPKETVITETFEETLQEEKRNHIRIYVKSQKEIYVNGQLVKNNIAKLIKKEAALAKKRGVDNVRAIIYSEEGIDAKSIVGNIEADIKKADVAELYFKELGVAAVGSYPDSPPPPPPAAKPKKDASGKLPPPPPPAPTIRDVLTGRAEIIEKDGNVIVRDPRAKHHVKKRTDHNGRVHIIEEVEEVDEVEEIEEVEKIEIEEGIHEGINRAINEEVELLLEEKQAMLEEIVIEQDMLNHDRIAAIEDIAEQQAIIAEEKARMIAEKFEMKEEHIRRIREQAERVAEKAMEKNHRIQELAQRKAERVMMQAERSAEQARRQAERTMERAREIQERKIERAHEREAHRNARAEHQKAYEEQARKLQEIQAKELERVHKKMEREMKKMQKKAEKRAKKIAKEFEKEVEKSK